MNMKEGQTYTVLKKVKKTEKQSAKSKRRKQDEIKDPGGWIKKGETLMNTMAWRLCKGVHKAQNIGKRPKLE